MTEPITRRATERTSGPTLALHQLRPIDPRTLRQVCGMWVTGVTVITTGSGPTSAGATVNSFTSVSLDPPLVLFCLHRGSRLLPVLEESGSFGVNFLAGQQEKLATAFARSETALLNLFEHHHSGDGVPVLSRALSFLACRVTERFEGGDHVIVVGEVLELGVPRHDREPLIFFGGALATLETQPFGAPQIWDL